MSRADLDDFTYISVSSLHLLVAFISIQSSPIQSYLATIGHNPQVLWLLLYYQEQCSAGPGLRWRGEDLAQSFGSCAQGLIPHKAMKFGAMNHKGCSQRSESMRLH